MNLNDMTFESPAPRGGTACDLGHGPDCIGHAWRVSDAVVDGRAIAAATAAAHETLACWCGTATRTIQNGQPTCSDHNSIWAR